jgi:hypothetical protein
MRARLVAFGKFVLFVAAFGFSGPLLNPILTRTHFPDRALTWSSLLLNDLLDFLLAAAIAGVLARIFHERFSSYGLPFTNDSGKLLLKGAIWGFVPSVLIVIPIYLAGACSFHGLAVRGSAFLFYAATWALAMLALGFAEEFLFRGYALKTLADAIHFWPAAIVLSSLFGLMHLFFKPQEDWIDPVSVSLYGIFWCLTLRRTGSLWFAVGFHAASDYTDMVVFAEPNTGNNGQAVPGHLLNVQFHGPAWLTGGPRGTEASLLVFVVLAGLFYFFNQAYPAQPIEGQEESPDPKGKASSADEAF